VASSLVTASGIRSDLRSSLKLPDALMQSWKDDYYKRYVDIYSVAPVRYIDDVIEPEMTRPVIIKALELLRHRNKKLSWKKHGNMPL